MLISRKNKLAQLVRILVIIVAGISSIVIHAQTPDGNVADLVRNIGFAHGFCRGQSRSLEIISKKFPKLGMEIVRAESEFAMTFGKSCLAIERMLPEDTKRSLETTLNAVLTGEISEEESLRFIAVVRERAKGSIESPSLETLLTFNPDFDLEPFQEFSRGFTKTFTTKGHSKALGLDLVIQVPKSWKAQEGKRPHIVQFFKNQNGYGDVAMVIFIKDVTLPKGVKISKNDVANFFTPASLNEYVPENAVLVESKVVVLDGQKGGMVVFDQLIERLDIKLKMRMLSYMTIYDNKMIQIQFTVMNSIDKTAEIVSRFEKNKRLFQLIANSFIIKNQYR